MRAGSCLALRRAVCAALLLAAAGGAAAVDNPDAPDLWAAFQARSAPYEQRVSDSAGGDASDALLQQARFLDAELNRAYQALLPRLDTEPRRQLVQAQRQWLKYRDSEQAFIGSQWTRARSGSSAPLSRGLFRAAMTRQRIELLLGYLRTLPPL